MSIRVVCIENPFHPEQRKIWDAEFVPTEPVRYYIGDITTIDGADFAIAVNGQIVADPCLTFPKDGDIISVAARLHDPISATVATWAASFVTEGLLSTIVYGAVYGLTFLGTAAAIGYGMNALVSALGLIEEPDHSGMKDSPTYGWDVLRPTMTEGNPIPIMFGTNKVAGQVINKFVTINTSEADEKEAPSEYLNLLLALCDATTRDASGDLDWGIDTDGITDIRINDQPVDNFKDITTYTRKGEKNDALVPEFSEIVTHQAFDIKLPYAEISPCDWSSTIQTDGTAVEKMQIILDAKRGLYHVKESGSPGKVEDFTHTIQVQYRAVGDSGWTDYGDVQMTGQGPTPVKKVVTIDSLSADQYEARMRITTTSRGYNEQKNTTDVWIIALKEIIDEALVYPGVAKYAVKALATDQLSGVMPAVSCLAARSAVRVYNADSSTWIAKSATNPAWACYALLNTHHGIDKDRLVWSEFEDWADYCDDLVGDSPGETRHQLNIVLETAENVWTQVQEIAKYGRGVIVRRGSKYGVFVDKAASPTHLFTMGNIVEGSFSMSYLPQEDRANAVEITYQDEDRDYTNQVVAVFSSDYVDSLNPSKKASIKYNAAIRRSQAIREASFVLNNNQLIKRAVEFEAFVDSFACQLGDVVYFQHEIPHYDTAGGRIVSARNDGGAGKVTLDQSVTLTGGTTYKVIVRLSDNTLVEKTVNNVATGTGTPKTELVLTTTWSSVPVKYDLYQFGPSDSYLKKWRITNITRGQELTRRITCLEYNENVYTDTSYSIDAPPWESGTADQEAVTIYLEENLIYSQSGSYTSVIDCCWQNVGRTDSPWVVWLFDTTLYHDFDAHSFNADSFHSHRYLLHMNIAGYTTNNYYRILSDNLLLGHTYQVVISPSHYGTAHPTYTDNNYAKIQILGKWRAPDNVTGFSASWDGYAGRVSLVWNAVTDLDLAYYEIRLGATWDEAVVVQTAERGSTAAIDYVAVEQDLTLTYLIKAVDTSGIYSETAATDDVDVVTTIPVPTGLDLSTSANIEVDGRTMANITATWDANAEVSDIFDHYVIKWENDSTGKINTVKIGSENEYTFLASAGVLYNVQVKSVMHSGQSSAYCDVESITAGEDEVAPSAPTTPGSGSIFSLPSKIILKWNHSGATEKDTSHFDVYRYTSNTFSNASKIGSSVKDFTSDTGMFVDDPGSYSTFHYWVVGVDYSGNESDELYLGSGARAKIDGAADIVASSITADSMAADSITAVQIDVATLDAISVDAGTITAGVLQNSDSPPSAQFDLDNGTFYLGPAGNPKLSWDGVTLEIEGNVTIGNPSGGISDYDGDPLPYENGTPNFIKAYINNNSAGANWFKVFEVDLTGTNRGFSWNGIFSHGSSSGRLINQMRAKVAAQATAGAITSSYYKYSGDNLTANLKAQYAGTVVSIYVYLGAWASCIFDGSWTAYCATGESWLDSEQDYTDALAGAPSDTNITPTANYELGADITGNHTANNTDYVEGSETRSTYTFTVGGNIVVEDGDIYFFDTNDVQVGMIYSSAADTFAIVGAASKILTISGGTTYVRAANESLVLEAQTSNKNISFLINTSTRFNVANARIDASVDFYGTNLILSGSISGATTITASGEVEGGSLDINGNADISGNLTGLDMSGDTATTGRVEYGTNVNIKTNSGNWGFANASLAFTPGGSGYDLGATGARFRNLFLSGEGLATSGFSTGDLGFLEKNCHRCGATFQEGEDIHLTIKQIRPNVAGESNIWTVPICDNCYKERKKR